jgi:hypothetical protein
MQVEVVFFDRSPLATAMVIAEGIALCEQPGRPRGRNRGKARRAAADARFDRSGNGRECAAMDCCHARLPYEARRNEVVCAA